MSVFIIYVLVNVISWVLDKKSADDMMNELKVNNILNSPKDIDNICFRGYFFSPTIFLINCCLFHNYIVKYAIDIDGLRVIVRKKLLI